jgi:YD repeat-containing protein
VLNGWGQPSQTVNVHGGQVNISYDAMGRVASQTNPFPQGGQPGPSTSYQYDGLGRAKVVTLANGNTIQNTYSGSSTTGIDQVSRSRQGQSDGLARLVKAVEQDATGALAQETSYTYDVLDRLTGVNQGGQTRAYKYDALGRLLYERIPEQAATINDGTGQMWSCKYTWTDFNAIQSKQDARGVITTYGYDELNRLTTVTYNTSGAMGVASTPSVTYSYDRTNTSGTKGLLLSASVGSGYSESYGHDQFNRVSSLTRTIDASQYTSQYQYNTANQLTQTINPSGTIVNSNHDDRGRLLSVTNQYGPYLDQIGYNSAGQLTGWTLANAMVESLGYDSQTLQMTSQSATRYGVTLLSLSYGYTAQAGEMGQGSTPGNAGKLMSTSGQINGQSESASFTYDLLGRLATSNQGTFGVSAQRRFGYDRFGNRTGVWDAVSGGTQVQSVSLVQSGGVPTNRINTAIQGGQTATCVYDSAGNVTSDGAHSYTLDAANRVTSVDSGSTASYSYDHQNRRYKKVAAGVTTHNIYEGNQVAAEYSASSDWVEYIYAGSKMIAKLSAGNQIRYFISDRLSIRIVLNDLGAVVGRQAGLPYGEELYANGESDKHQFTSYERDSETGTDYAVNRYHVSGLGRFSSVDPVSGA